MKNLTISNNSLVAQASKTNKPKSETVVNTPLIDLPKEDIDDLVKQCDELHTNISEKYNLRKYKQLNDAMTTLTLVRASLLKINQ